MSQSLISELRAQIADKPTADNWYSPVQHASLTRLLDRIERLEGALTQALGILVEFGDLNGFRNLTDEELGRAVLTTAENAAAALEDRL